MLSPFGIICSGLVAIVIFLLTMFLTRRILNHKEEVIRNIKKVGSAIWEIVVVFAYIKFYAMCVMTFLMVMVLSIYVLSQAGIDITDLIPRIKIAGYLAIASLAIIYADKIIKLFKRDKK